MSKETNQKEVIDLDIMSVTDILSMILELHDTDFRTDIKCDFIGDVNFELIVYGGWLFVKVANHYDRQLKYLRSCKPSMIFHSGVATLCAFYKEERTLQLNDFNVIVNLWNLIRCINFIGIKSHQISFKRFTPIKLQTLCLRELDINQISITLPKSALRKLGLLGKDTDSLNL